MKVYQYKGFGFIEGYASDMTFEDFKNRFATVAVGHDMKVLFKQAGGKLTKKKKK